MITHNELTNVQTTTVRTCSYSPFAAPANNAPRSRLYSVPFKCFGTSFLTILWASPSAIAVFPTPGSPLSRCQPRKRVWRMPIYVPRRTAEFFVLVELHKNMSMYALRKIGDVLATQNLDDSTDFIVLQRLGQRCVRFLMLRTYSTDDLSEFPLSDLLAHICRIPREHEDTSHHNVIRVLTLPGTGILRHLLALSLTTFAS